MLFYSGRLAQLVERLPYKQNVGGSIPSAPTIFSLYLNLNINQHIALILPIAEIFHKILDV
jgi:cyanate lyase